MGIWPFGILFPSSGFARDSIIGFEFGRMIACINGIRSIVAHGKQRAVLLISWHPKP